MKKLRIGRRRGKGDGLPVSPLELALWPALSDGRWQVPDRFNFARDVVEGLAGDPKRRAVTFIGKDGIIEPRTFHVLSERAARWSWLLRERGVRPGDPVLVLAGTNVDWIEIVLACVKVGAVVVPGPPTLSAESLDVRLERTGADLVVAERSAEQEIGRTTNSPMVLYVDDGRTLLPDAPEQAPTHDTSARDIAFVVETPGTAGVAKLVGHSHGAVFAARVAAEHWLDAGRGDAVWCPAQPGSAESIWNVLVGPWSRGAELVLHDAPFDALERLDLIYRLGVTVLCQTPAEYGALAELRQLARFRPPQIRRLVSSGEWLDPDVTAAFEEAWGMTIHDGYGQAETNIVVGNGADAGFKAGALGVPLPGHQVAVIDDQGNELPPNTEGELAVRGRPPTLFAGYWESPEQTKQAFRGDWYATGDLATVDEDGFFWFVGRKSDVITSRGERFGPYAAERALRAHKAVTGSAVVGVRDLERGGQFVRAFVVLAPGVAESEQLEAELRHEVSQTLAEHEVPREIEFVDELPMAPGGKVRRLELRERLVVGRPLWEVPQAEPEHDPWAGMLEPWPAEATERAEPEALVEQPASDALPDYIVPPAPEPEPPVAAVPEAPEPVLEALPEYVEPEPEPAIELVAAPEPMPEPVPPEPEPEPEPEPPPAPEPEPPGEPVVHVLPGPPSSDPAPPDPHTQPEPIVEPDRDLPVDPVPAPDPAPDLVPVPEPEPEPQPEPEVAAAVEPEPEPEPVALVEPEPEPEPDDVEEPVALVEENELEAAPEPEPEAAHEPEPEPEAREVAEPTFELDDLPKDVWVPILTESEPGPPPGVAEQPPEPDFIVEPVEEPPVAAPRRNGDASRPKLTADDILKPKPPPGPLPDFIVEPSAGAPAPEPPIEPLRSSHTPAEPVEPESDPIEAPAAGAGLPPLSDFPSLPVFPTGPTKPKPEPELTIGDAETAADGDEALEDEDSEPRGRRGRRRSEPPTRRRTRSASDPGDASEAVDWAGLSSRLSAYSLSDEAARASAESDAEPEQGADEEDEEQA